jgi:anti-sigma regulatory factor (Ser/Thr protein kinase)
MGRELTLDPEPAAAGAARRFVTAVCAEWNLGHLVEAATVVASELVSNAVRHAMTPMLLSVELCDSFLYIVVHDQRPDGELPPDHSRLVDVYATARGVCQPREGELESGKRVWASIRAVPVTSA